MPEHPATVNEAFHNAAFVEGLPLTASQKLQRGVLKDVSRNLVDAGQVFDLRALKRCPGKIQPAA